MVRVLGGRKVQEVDLSLVTSLMGSLEWGSSSRPGRRVLLSTRVSLHTPTGRPDRELPLVVPDLARDVPVLVPL